MSPTQLAKVDFAELVPEPLSLLGQAAVIQLESFENLARAVAGAPSLASKEGLSAAAGVALRKHHALIAELRRDGVEPVDVMEPFAPELDTFRDKIAGVEWAELLLGIHVASGMLDDFFGKLAEGLPHDRGTRVRAILAEAGASDVLKTELEGAIAAEPGLADRLALWGRSLVGDTLLIARSALRAAEPAGRGDEDVEPVFTELIAEHTRRMDALGLTA